MAFELPPLPYARDALAPHMSEQTLDFHYGKHHQTYVNNLNGLVEGTEHEGKPLENIIRAAGPGGLFNNAAQVWNHTFFWSCMKPSGGGKPSGDLAQAIDRDFGSFDKFKEEFANAGNPMTEGKTPILTLDVWEHAYYIDYRNARPDFIESFLDNLVNWEFVAQNLGS